MATFNSSGMTSGAVKQNHLGPNVAIQQYLQAATVSASDQINMTRVPPGAEVYDVTLICQGVPGSGLAVKDNLGNVYISTTTATTQIPIRANANGMRAGRLTASAHLYIEKNGLQAALAGSDSCTYTLITSYLAEKSGD